MKRSAIRDSVTFALHVLPPSQREGQHLAQRVFVKIESREDVFGPLPFQCDQFLDDAELLCELLLVRGDLFSVQKLLDQFAVDQLLDQRLSINRSTRLGNLIHEELQIDLSGTHRLPIDTGHDIVCRSAGSAPNHCQDRDRDPPRWKRPHVDSSVCCWLIVPSSNSES